MVLGRVEGRAVFRPDEEAVLDFHAVDLALFGVEVGDAFRFETLARALLEVEVFAVAFVEPLLLAS